MRRLARAAGLPAPLVNRILGHEYHDPPAVLRRLQRALLGP
jgi:hypothetical protein